MKNPMVWVIVVVLVALGAWYWSMSQDQAELEGVDLRPAVDEPAAQPPPPRFPVEQVAVPVPPVGSPEPLEQPELPPAEPLPALDESDPEALEEAQALWPETDLSTILVPDYLLSRLVATLDGLDARRLPQPMRPVMPIPGRFEVLKANDEAVISPANAERYRPYLDLLYAVDVESIVPLYVRYYPLLQEAFLGLGYEDAHFNDRMVEILDHLLATPEPLGLIEVVQNEAVYEFVDPDLEALSVGQKALLRLSAEDRQQIKPRLRRLRDALNGTGLEGQ